MTYEEKQKRKKRQVRMFIGVYCLMVFSIVAFWTYYFLGGM